MAVGIGMRTIWITLRAVNYTSRAFRTVIGDLKALAGWERYAADVGLDLIKMGTAFIQTGMMMASIGAMVGQSMWALAMESKKSWMEVAELNRNIKNMKTALADTLFDILKSTGALNLLNSILKTIQQNKYIQWIILGFMIFAAIALVVVGALFILAGALLSVIGINVMLPIVLAKASGMLAVFGIHVNLTTASLRQMAIAAGAAFAVFTILMAIGGWIGPVAGAIIAAIVAITVAFWSLFIAESAATLGIALAIGAAAAAVAMSVQAAHGFQMGTRALPHTGLFLGHKGEVVYNPATGRPTQIAGDIEGGRGEPRRTDYDITINIDNVHTKADFNDLDKKIKRSIAEAMRDRE